MLYSTTCKELIELLCRTILDDWKAGTATSGSTSTIVDTNNRAEADDYFQGTSPVSYAYILTTTDNAAPKNEERRATDFANSSATLTVAPNWSAAVGAGDTYTIIHLKRWADLKAYINMAINLAKTEVLIPKIDETSLAIQSDVLEYPVPDGFTHIYRLTQALDTGSFMTEPVNPAHYSILRAASPPKIRFLALPENMRIEGHYHGELWYDNYAEVDRKLRVEGFAAHPELTEDTDTCYIDPNFVVAQAGALIHASLIRRADNEPDEHKTQMQVWQNVANSIRAGAGFRTMLPPNCKRVS